MSGGPVFDAADYKLIGINGRTAFPVVSSYVYEDGSKPSPTEVQQMRQVNWSIPIRTVLAQVQPTILTAYKLPLPESDPGVKTGKLAGWLGEIEAKAKQFTVRIDSSSGKNGSGVIVARQGNTYTVLTAEHVLCEREAATEPCGAQSYTIATHDGKTYALNKSRFRTEIGVDLGVVEFESDAVYPVATLAINPTSQRKLKNYVFVAGFPKVSRNTAPQWMFSGGQIFHKDEGLLRVSDSHVASSSDSNIGLTQSQASFAGGYEMVYTSITYGGMSGGAVLDSQGQVIGIHGLAEGESNTDEGKIQMGNSLGVPINTFVGLISRFQLTSQQLSIASTEPSDLNLAQDSDLIGSILQVVVPKENAKASIWIERGNQLLHLERYAEAEQAFERAIQLNPSFVHLALYGKGIALERQKKYSESIRTLEASLLKQPSYTPALNELSVIYRELEEYEKALMVINKAIQFEPRNVNLYNEKWEVLNNLQRHQDALSIISQAIMLSPRVAFYNHRGITYSNLNEYPKAIAEFTKAISINPKIAETYYLRGFIYHDLKEYSKAIMDYTEIIAIYPKFSHLYSMRGRAYYDAKKYPKAIADYTKAINDGNSYNSSDAYIGRGNTYHDLKEYSKAIINYSKAIAISKNTTNGYTNRGNAYAASKEYDKAITDYDKAIEINPENAFAYIGRGATYTALMIYHKAITDYNKAIAILSVEADEYHQKRGPDYTSTGNIQQAKQDLQTAAQLFRQQGRMIDYDKVMQIFQRL
jgi:tetratricopeptide (TPR) repeat protein